MKNALALRTLRRCSFAIIILTVCGYGTVLQTSGKFECRASGNEISVVPDTYGTITHMVIHYDPDARHEVDRTYRDLFEALPKDVLITVLCPSKAAASEFENTWKDQLAGRTVRLVNVGIPLSIWARDRSVFRQSLSLGDPAPTYVPANEPTYEACKTNDLVAMEMLGKVRLIPRVLDSPLHIEGGNIVSNKRHVFLGANIFEDNESIMRSEIDVAVQRIFGRKPLIIGDAHGQVPWVHIDMYVTPVSDDTVVVASPRMAEMILSTQQYDNIGYPSATDTGIATCSVDCLQNRFDVVASYLEGYGYRVIRLPVIVNEPEDYMVTYNNVIMDIRNGRRILYMPVYDLPCLDQAAEAIYDGLGFEVRTINVAGVYTNGGAVRCLFNVAQRQRDDTEPFNIVKDRRIRVHDLAGSRRFDRLLDQSSRRLASRGQTLPVEHSGLAIEPPSGH